MRQSTPCVTCTQALGLRRGTKVRFSRLIRPMSAPSGQKLAHQRRRTSSSTTRNAAKITTDQPASLNWKRRERAITSAKVRPTGQIRQKTGKPKTALEARAPAKTVRGPAVPPAFFSLTIRPTLCEAPHEVQPPQPETQAAFAPAGAEFGAACSRSVAGVSFASAGAACA